MTGHDIQSAVAGAASLQATTNPDGPSRTEDENLAKLGPFAVTISPVSGDAIKRSYDDPDACHEPGGSSAILAPVQVHVVSNDGSIDVSGTTTVYGGDPLWFSADPEDSRLLGQIPSWADDAASDLQGERCRGDAADVLVYGLLFGDPASFTFSIEVDYTGDCVSQADLAEVVLDGM